MTEQQPLQDFLVKIQLSQFYQQFVDVLHVTRIEHFEHVIDTDLQKIGMSMPEIRRLFDQVRKNKRNVFIKKLKKSFKKSINTNVDASVTSLNPTSEYITSPKQEAKCLIQEKDIKFIEVIGKGAFGSVRSAEWTTQDQERVLVAVKCIRRTNGNGIEDVQSEVVKEANAMSYLNHPNLIRFFGVLISSPMMLVTELAPLGTLLKKLRQEREKFQISILCSFVVQIAAGMKYLEKNKIVHRDLAARNILLMSYEKVKIADFGLARLLDQDVGHYVMHPDGLIPFAWCAPECLKYKRFSHASDVWAFGITICELFTYGIEPWPGLNGAQILDRIGEPNNERPPCPEFCPREIYNVLKGHCWNYKESERAEFQDIEKILLSVLPIEVKAVNTSDSLISVVDDLCFSIGDIITVFNTNSFDGTWKGQNRRTGQVGYFPASFVNIEAGTISNEATPPTINLSDTTDKVPYNRSSVPPADGFSNKLWNIWDAETDCLASKQQLTRVSNLRDDIEVTNSIGSGGISSTGSYCEDCFSQNSVDSGCLSRCSTYSSDSSQRCSTEFTSRPLSKPIAIPGNRVQYQSGGTANNRRCSSCCSNRHSAFSDTLDRDLLSTSPFSNSFSTTNSSTGFGSDFDELQRNISKLKVADKGNTSTIAGSTYLKTQEKLSASEGKRSSLSSIIRRRSLPDLANPRKRNLLRRSLKQRKRKEILTKVKSKDDIDISAPTTTGTKFYLPGQNAVITDLVSASLESRIACPLYDLVPIRDRKETEMENLDELSHYSKPRSVFADNDLFAASTPRRGMDESGSARTNNITDDQNEIYENVNDFVVPPVAPPRRKKRNQPTKRSSMFELGGKDVIQYGSLKQCLILDHLNQ